MNSLQFFLFEYKSTENLTAVFVLLSNRLFANLPIACCQNQYCRYDQIICKGVGAYICANNPEFAAKQC
jgi:hypothetical protein